MGLSKAFEHSQLTIPSADAVDAAPHGRGVGAHGCGCGAHGRGLGAHGRGVGAHGRGLGAHGRDVGAHGWEPPQRNNIILRFVSVSSGQASIIVFLDFTETTFSCSENAVKYATGSGAWHHGLGSRGSFWPALPPG